MLGPETGRGRGHRPELPSLQSHPSEEGIHSPGLAVTDIRAEAKTTHTWQWLFTVTVFWACILFHIYNIEQAAACGFGGWQWVKQKWCNFNFFKGKLYMKNFLDVNIRETKICKVANQTGALHLGWVPPTNTSIWTYAENNVKWTLHSKNHMVHFKGKHFWNHSLPVPVYGFQKVRKSWGENLQD